MPRLFISYSRKDEDFARKLATDLERLGADIWIDVDDIPAGMKWSSAIQQGLDQADVMLVIISPDSMASTNVEDEWQYFLDQRRPIVPVLWKPAKIHFQLSRVQYVNFHNQDYDMALRRLYAELGHIGVVLQPIRGNENVIPRQVEVPKVRVMPSAVPTPPASKTILQTRSLTTLGIAIAILIFVVGLILAAPRFFRPTTPSSASSTPSGTLSTISMRVFGVRGNIMYSVAFSPDGKQVLAGASVSPAQLWDTASGQLIRTFSGHTDAVDSVAFSPDGKQVLTGSRDKTARLWNAASGQLIRTLSLSYLAHSVAFSPDGKQVLIGTDEIMARLWDVASGQLIRTFSGHTASVNSVAFSPDGRYILTGSDDHSARLWDAASGQLIRTFSGHTSSVASVAFSPDGKQVLTGSWDRTARLWDVASGQLIRTFSGHTDGVGDVAFSPSGKQILTGSRDDTARLWDVANGQVIRTFTGHSDDVTGVAFSPDGKQVLTACYDGTARLWNIEP